LALLPAKQNKLLGQSQANNTLRMSMISGEKDERLANGKGTAPELELEAATAKDDESDDGRQVVELGLDYDPFGIGSDEITSPPGGFASLTSCASWDDGMLPAFLPCCAKSFHGCVAFPKPSLGVDCDAIVSDILFKPFEWTKLDDSFRFYPFGKDITSVCSWCLWGIPAEFPEDGGSMFALEWLLSIA
jgi:hypothetical protein